MRSFYSMPKDELETFCLLLSVYAFLYEALSVTVWYLLSLPC